MKTAHHSPTIMLPRRTTAAAEAATASTTAFEADVPVDAVCDLLAAAGPLTIENIAGGLNVAAQRVSAYVRWMLNQDLLRQDEFDRYRACGACVR